VVEEDATGSVHAVGLSEVDGCPVCHDFGAGVWGAWPEGCGFFLWCLDDFAVHFGGGCLVVADFLSGLVLEVSDGFEEAEGAHADGVGGVDGHVEGDADM